MPYRNIIYQVENKIAQIILNRPEKLNAMNAALVTELATASKEADADACVNVIVIRGAGRAFCAGYDMADFLSVFDEASLQNKGHWMYTERRPLINVDTRKPVIVAINGYCAGHGLTLALKCDIRIASEDASFAMPQVKRGIFPLEGIQVLPRCVPMSLAMQMLLTGEPVTAYEALQAGLISKVVKPEELIPAAIKLAGKMCESAPLTVRLTKEAAIRCADLPQDEGMRVAWDLKLLNDETEDFYEGILAFKEKRAPRFTGK